MVDRITSVMAREILSGPGKPTVEVTVVTDSGIQATASVPSGTSTGAYEAKELYDGGMRYRGLGVRNAVSNVNNIIAPKLIGVSVRDLEYIDHCMLELDGTKDKSHLGGNAILPVSVAAAKAGAWTGHVPVYRHFSLSGSLRIPVPIATVLAGGKYSSSPLEFEDYILVCIGFNTFSEALEALVETRKVLEELLRKSYGTIADVGGAFAPEIRDTEEAFEFMLKAASQAGCEGRIFLGLDIAGTDLAQDDGSYILSDRKYAYNKLEEYYQRLISSYPLVFIEDPYHEDDFSGFSRLLGKFPNRYIVGDDLFATNPYRLQRGIEGHAANTLLLKVNQIGTVTEALQSARIAKEHNLSIAVSLRSNDTNDDFVSDFSVAVGAEFIKLGSPVRGERNAKYNRLLLIEQELGSKAHFAGIDLLDAAMK